jgi:hypothetical protein
MVHPQKQVIAIPENQFRRKSCHNTSSALTSLESTFSEGFKTIPLLKLPYPLWNLMRINIQRKRIGNCNKIQCEYYD